MLRRPAPRRMNLQMLEERTPLAVASFSGGTLKITGNNSAEELYITQPDHRTLLVQGTGFPAEGRSFSNVKNIKIDMKGGDDLVVIGVRGEGVAEDSIELLGNIDIQLGAGSDTAYIFVNTIGNVTVNDVNEKGAKHQNDSVYVADSIIQNLRVNLHAGDDCLIIERSAILSVNAKLGVDKLGKGQIDSDYVLIENSAIFNLSISVGTADAGERDPKGEGEFLDLPPASAESSEYEESEEPGCEIPYEPVAGRNIIALNSNILGKVNLLGGAGQDEVIVASEESGIGPYIRPHLVSLVDDLEPWLQEPAVQRAIQTIWSRLDVVFSQLFPGGTSLPDLRGIDLSEIDPSDLLDEVLSDERLSFINQIGQQTVVILSLNIDTRGADDFVCVSDVLVVGTATIKTGQGDDEVHLINLQVFGGLATLSNPLKNAGLKVLLEQGNDLLFVHNIASINSYFDGGAGVDDVYSQSGDNFLLFGKLLNFESSGSM